MDLDALFVSVNKISDKKASSVLKATGQCSATTMMETGVCGPNHDQCRADLFPAGHSLEDCHDMRRLTRSPASESHMSVLG